MNPEKFAQELELINNRDMSEQTARMFMTELNKQLRLYPQLKNDPLILKQIERFEYDLSQVEIDWAQEQLAALQKFKSERGMLAGEVDENSTAAGKKEVQNENEAPRAGSKSLETLDPEIDSFNVLTLAKTTLLAEGYEYTVAGVKKYQEAHKIGIDGVIGKETYLEMKASELTEKVLDRIDIAGISPTTQKEVELHFTHANLAGINSLELKRQLLGFQERHKNDADFDTRYKKFFENIELATKKYTETPEGQKATTIPPEAGKTMKEYLENGDIAGLLSDPKTMFYGVIAYLFFGGSMGLPFSDSIFKRIGVALGAVAFGPGFVKFTGIGDAIKEGQEYLRSPAAETAVATATSDAENIFKSARDWGVDGWNNVSSKVMEFYGETFKNHENQNEKEKTAGAEGNPSEKYIDKFSEKWSYIMADKTLFTDENIQKIVELSDISKTGLFSLLDESTKQQLIALGVDEQDAKNLLLWHIIPEAKTGQSKGLSKFGEIFTSVAGIVNDTLNSATIAGAEALGYGFVTTGSLNIQIQDNINKLLLDLGSTPDAIKAAQNLPSLLRQDPIIFDYSAYPGLTVGEKGEKEQIADIIQLVTDIRLREGMLMQYKDQIDAVDTDVSAMNDVAQKQILLEQRWNKLQGIKSDYTSARPNIIDIGVTTETLDTAFAQKEREILDIALQSGITTLAGISVTTAVQQASTNEAIANRVNIMQEYLANLEALPPSTATPLELKAWYERNNIMIPNKDGSETPLFEAVEALAGATNLPAGSNEALIADAAKKILERKDAFIAQYEATKMSYIGKFKDLNDKVVAFDTTSITEQNFDTKQRELAGFSNVYSQYMSEIEASWIKDVSSKITGKVSDWWNGTYSVESSSSAFMIDGIESEKPNPDITLVETSLKTKAEEMKNAFDRIAEEKIGTITIVSMKPALDPIIANIRTKLQVSDPERYEIFKNTIQDPSVTKVSDLLKVFDTLIETIELELSLTQDEGAKNQLNTQINLFKDSKEETVSKIKGGLSQDVITWIEQLYGNVDDYYQSLIQ